MLAVISAIDCSRSLKMFYFNPARPARRTQNRAAADRHLKKGG
jgi:hypothetical protein